MIHFRNQLLAHNKRRIISNITVKLNLKRILIIRRISLKLHQVFINFMEEKTGGNNIAGSKFINPKCKIPIFCDISISPLKLICGFLRYNSGQNKCLNVAPKVMIKGK